MFFPEGRVRIFVYGEPVNLRYSFDGLYALVPRWTPKLLHLWTPQNAPPARRCSCLKK